MYQRLPNPYPIRDLILTKPLPSYSIYYNIKQEIKAFTIVQFINKNSVTIHLDITRIITLNVSTILHEIVTIITDLSLKRQSQNLVNLTTFYDTNFNFPIINDIQWTEIINQTGLNDNGIMNLQGDKVGGNDRSKVLDDLLNYTLEI